MLTNFQIHDLIALLRLRYPDWDNISFPPFAADELDYKRNIITQAQEALDQETLDQLLAAGVRIRGADESGVRTDRLHADPVGIASG